jgi:hypothetical protein
MFWNRNKEAAQKKLPAPTTVPELVKKSPQFAKGVDAGTTPFLKAATKGSEKGEKTYDVRIFDPADAEARHIAVKDYNSLTGHEELIIGEGWYSDAAKNVDLNIKRQIPPPKLLTYGEILPQIEGLKEPGSSVFFYMSAGPGAGGPLGRGASVISLNTPLTAEGKKQKKYSIYGGNVVDMQPTDVTLKIFDSDKATDIAKWIAESQKPRFC